jgi:putative glutathione S-transferase
MSDPDRAAELPDETGDDGSFQRQRSVFRDSVGTDAHPVEAGRYHLYVSLACPWAHRTIIARELLGLGDAVSLSVVDPIRDERGWAFREGRGHGPDPINGFDFLEQTYRQTDPGFEGRVTVPTLYDVEARRVVNNESAEILVMLDQAFRPLAAPGAPELYPETARAEIDEVDADVYEHVNNGVYRCGFAASQAAYDAAFDALFAGLDRLEVRLAGRHYLCGDRLTTADIRLYTTLVRFDAVYQVHFKCNRQRLSEFEHLSGYLRDLYQTPGFGSTTDFDHIKRHYYCTHRTLNPSGIVPRGPALDLDAPHDRARLAPDGPFGA